MGKDERNGTDARLSWVPAASSGCSQGTVFTGTVLCLEMGHSLVQSTDGASSPRGPAVAPGDAAPKCSPLLRIQSQLRPRNHQLQSLLVPMSMPPPLSFSQGPKFLSFSWSCCDPKPLTPDLVQFHIGASSSSLVISQVCQFSF